MPSINIYERDLTSPYSTDTTSNIVFIPGYANKGPINTPILCKTLSEFYATFGSKPYTFRTTQPYPETAGCKFTDAANPSTNGSFYEIGDHEKSYVIAAELLSKNLPVLFERVIFDTANIKYAEATSNSITLKAKQLYSGIAGYLITYSITKTGDYYTLNIKLADASDNTELIVADNTIKAYKLAQQLGISEIEEEFNFVLSEDNTTPSFIYYRDIQSNIVDITWGESIALETANGRLKYKGSTGNTYVENITGDDFNVTDIYSEFLQSNTDEDHSLYKLKDRGEYQIKFLTLGAYPSFEFGKDGSYNIFNNLIQTAGERGDCIALVDHTFTGNTRSLSTSSTSGSVYTELSDYVKKNVITIVKKGGDSEDGYTYSAMFTPYATYTLTTQNNSQYILPASFGYLNALAASTQSNPNWYAVAGVSRGIPSGLVGLTQNVTNTIADLYQPRDDVSINCITNIKPYGYTIWGNRTLKNNSAAGDLKALSFLNIRMLTSDLKKILYQACKRYTFENNTDIMWLNFKSQIEPTLSKMLSGNGIASYQIIKVATTKKATIEAIIRLVPIEPVEDWYITIELTDGVEANIQ